MKREEMIKVLSGVGIRTIPTVATEDMGLQYDYITPEGAGTGFGGMGAWPLWHFGPINTDRWPMILDAIHAGNITIDMLNGTGLDIMLREVQSLDEPIDYAKLLRKLPGLGRTDTDYYCLFDVGQWHDSDSEVEFYPDKASLLARFAKDYCDSLQTWDSMDDDELADWYARLSDDLKSTFFCEPNNSKEDA